MLCRCYADAEAIFFWWNLVSTPEALQIVSLLLPQKRQRQILIVFPWFPFDVQVKDFIKATVATIGYRYHLWNMFEPTSYFWSKCQMQKWVPKVRTLVNFMVDYFLTSLAGKEYLGLKRAVKIWISGSWVMSISRITVGCASRLLELNQFLAKEYLGDPLPIYHSVDEWRLFYAWCTNRFCHWGVMGVADVKTSNLDVQIHFSLFSLSAAEPFEDRLQEILQRILTCLFEVLRGNECGRYLYIQVCSLWRSIHDRKLISFTIKMLHKCPESLLCHLLLWVQPCISISELSWHLLCSWKDCFASQFQEQR